MPKLWKAGDAYIWISGLALMITLVMIGGLLFLIATKGLGSMWPADIGHYTLRDGSVYLGQFRARESVRDSDGVRGSGSRVKLKIGNRDLYGLDFKWINEADIASHDYPRNAVVLERHEWGNYHGYLKDIRKNGIVIPGGSPEAFSVLRDLIRDSNEIHAKILKIEKGEIGDINYGIEKRRLKLRGLAMRGEDDPVKEAEHRLKIKEYEERYKASEAKLEALYAELNRNEAVMISAGGDEKVIPLGKIVLAFRPNDMGFGEKAGFYVKRFWGFVSDDPREANTEGGIFPAIFGTVLMVFIMSIVVMPFGVIAALYLREYARQGVMVRIVRICVNNLAGVPSIVFGVFGVGFFLYGVGGIIDSVFFKEALPSPTFGTGGILWASLTLALLTVPVVIVATEEGLAAVPRNIREGSLALGATKFETTWKVVIPSALPAILTGLILAVARATGEVAPLMITGVVKLAPDLPIDGHFPFLHLERKFMHLGFHIYDLGFQSPNAEAAKSMVFMTAFLLILIVVVLNITAIIIRNRLRKKYATSAV
ncbi:MAG: phosphate ABC transporter permease PstA [Candidatus Dadabacteria bacterium]|nr:phosphate ABC transporter permease PstA [Candidatus Dadabacteria bacterium]MYB27037.1 phosphate ABC transporter permease PstA [Candidatus Dadabacteria bacterium]